MKAVAGGIAPGAASAVIAALVLGEPRPAPAPVPSVFCPSGEHVTGVRAGEPVCAGEPSPRPAGLGMTP